MSKSRAKRSLQLGSADHLAKLIVMALVALAISAGLHMQLAWSAPLALTTGVSLFLVMAILHAVLAHGGSGTSGSEAAAVARLDEIAGRLDRMVAQRDGIEALVGRLERLEASAASVAAHIGVGQKTGELSQLDRLSAEVDALSARFDALRTHVDIDAKDRHERITAELQMLETLVKQLAEHVTAATGHPSQHAPTISRPQPGNAEAVSAASSTGGAAAITADHVKPASFGPVDVDSLDAAVLNAVRRSVEANKVDLYLQPIVTLPQRRVRYYEALTRLRDGEGNILLPKDYLQVAETAGMMPLIDNVMLYRSVQVLKRLSERSSGRGVFCNISLHSLLDPEFFPEFIAFMEQNRSLAEGLSFEFSQRMIESCGPIENESLQALAGLGFRFVLDQVHKLDIDFAALHDKGFRFIKIEGDLLLHRMAESGARIHAADMRAYLDRHGLELIVEKIEEERSLAELLDFDVKLGQGYLFSEPRPVRREVFGGGEADAEAA